MTDGPVFVASQALVTFHYIFEFLDSENFLSQCQYVKE